MFKKMFDRRLYQREKVELIARYFIQDTSVKYMGCTVINLSRNGAGAFFPRQEKIEEGAVVLIDIIAPVTYQQLRLKGEIKRARKHGNVMYAGIQFIEALSEETFSMLCKA
ncbi:MAG: PilZ domain-containing protein [Deltaproteobacteria bacterium]|nr:PilZ domain-containing protein [Deltaproteobacteria bacterium]